MVPASGLSRCSMPTEVGDDEAVVRQVGKERREDGGGAGEAVELQAGRSAMSERAGNERVMNGKACKRLPGSVEEHLVGLYRDRLWICHRWR